MKHDDTSLRAEVEEAVDMIRAAQHPDGYLNSYYTVCGIQHRWTNLRDMHELYCLGHLIEACVAYETLTGSGRLLETVMKCIQHVNSIFGSEPGKKRGYPGHQEIEIGLLRLYQLTRNPLCLNLAQYFIHERGRRDSNGETYFDLEAKARGADPYDQMGTELKPTYAVPRDYGYHQADCPLVDATEVKGHSVRAMYFYTAATQLVGLTRDGKLGAALDRLWRDLVDTKLYVTGSLGAIRQWEGFGPAYRLGDVEEDGTCYTETCASFALINWCQQMLRLCLNSEYADVMEIALYNGFLGAVGLDGSSFYYQNPLRTFTGRPKHRSTWFEVACCPPNVAKLFGQLGSLIYSFTDNLVAIHLYIGSTFAVPGTDVVVSQRTTMPWSGEVEITVRGSTGLALRIPSWSNEYTCSVQGSIRNGYLHIPPSNLSITSIGLTFSLKPRKVYANPKTDKDEVCLMRGPLVYCIEDVDNAVDVDHVAVVDGPVEEAEARKIATVEHVVSLTTAGKELVNPTWSTLYGSEPWKYSDVEKPLVLIPYFLRANRGGNGGMRVWTRRL